VERVLFAPRELPSLPPDVAEDPDAYSEWVGLRERARHAAAAAVPIPTGPLRIILAMQGEPGPETVPTLEGLQHQTTSDWVLTAVVSERWHTAFTALLAVSGLHRTSQRVRVEQVDDSSGLYAMLETGLRAGEGSAVALLFPGDVWAPDAVAQLSAALGPDGVAYADQDVLAGDGRHIRPQLKPAYSPEFLLSASYIGRPIAFGSDVVAQLLRTARTETEQVEHDVALRACEVARRVHHIPEVLCHRLEDSQEVVVSITDTRHVDAALRRRGESATSRPGTTPGTFRVMRDGSGCQASVIIPFRDEPQLLRSCIDSIDGSKGAHPLELILIDNGSVQPETATLLERLAERPDVRVLSDGRPFNWAQLNNAGAAAATGDVLIFLNNDIEAHAPGWLEALCGQARRPDVGAVGARLLYPDRRVQHCGVVIGLGGAAGHILVGLAQKKPGYLGMATLARECAAVTGACLATSAEVFAALHGFDESLGVDLNDIDYCLRGQVSGLRVIYEPQAELIHLESPSRGTAGDVKDIVRFIERWRDSIVADDPFLNPHLTRVDSSCRLRGPDEKDWWHQWVSTLSQP
jgi:GT2 family glycosyltransferase